MMPCVSKRRSEKFANQMACICLIEGLLNVKFRASVAKNTVNPHNLGMVSMTVEVA